jgi:hypothetical protein
LTGFLALWLAATFLPSYFYQKVSINLTGLASNEWLFSFYFQDFSLSTFSPFTKMIWKSSSIFFVPFSAHLLIYISIFNDVPHFCKTSFFFTLLSLVFDSIISTHLSSGSWNISQHLEKTSISVWKKSVDDCQEWNISHFMQNYFQCLLLKLYYCPM